MSPKERRQRRRAGFKVKRGEIITKKKWDDKKERESKEN